MLIHNQQLLCLLIMDLLTGVLNTEVKEEEEDVIFLLKGKRVLHEIK